MVRKFFAVVAMLCACSTLNADFTENFDTGTLGTFTSVDLLGAGVSDVIGWDHNTNVVDGADVRGNFSSGDAGGAAHADTDAFGSGGTAYDIALVSPVFTVDQFETLTFTHMFRSLDTTDFGDVEITTDGGATWGLVVSYADTVGTIPSFPYTDYVNNGVTESIDLVAGGFASAGDSAQVRFRYRGDSWDWWWQVDNVSAFNAVPEPSSLMVFGAFGALFLRRKKS